MYRKQAGKVTPRVLHIHIDRVVLFLHFSINSRIMKKTKKEVTQYMSEILEFDIVTYDYANPSYKDWERPMNRHFLYILENGSQAYIGETNNIVKRTKEHHQESDYCYQFGFSRIHIITREDMDETPAKHFEKMLICLMRADGKYTITNRSDGENTFYARKNIFELGFDELWGQLAALNLVKYKEFQSVLNRPEYKYSPYTVLTEYQSRTLANIVNAIRTSDSQRKQYTNETRPILLEGDAGTGKTVIAASLFHYLKTNPEFSGKKVGLVYANTSTREEMQKVFQFYPGNFDKDMIAPIDVTKQQYDIIICDEAHRLRRNKNLGVYITQFRKGNSRLDLDDSNDELDWLCKNAGCLVLLYDKQQIVSPSDVPYDIFAQRLEIDACGTRPVTLQDQMRIRAGNNYVPYIYAVLQQETTAYKQFDGYDFKLFDSFSDMINMLNEKEKQLGLCRLCGGYAWKWIAKQSPTTPDISIDGVDDWWNKQTKGWLRRPMAKKEMGSIYTLPGLDLNYAAVVIGPELYYDTSSCKIKVNKKHFFDNKVKRGVTDEELTRFIVNTYGVLMTRGIYGTYVYVCDNALREYLKRFIPAF